jgi:small subunit ribosomal protein S6
MPVYDSTFILNPQIEEAGCDSRIKNLIKLIDENGGKLVKENRIGMRRMAYEIQKLSQGYYVSLVYEGNNEVVNELERNLRLDESCLRFLTCHHQENAGKSLPRVSRDRAQKPKPEEHKPETVKPVANIENATKTSEPEAEKPKVKMDEQTEISEPEGEKLDQPSGKDEFSTTDDADSML